MCEPTALAIGSFALTAGGEIASHKGQRKAAKENKRAALADLRIQQHDLSLRQQEEQAASAREIDQARRQGREARSFGLATAAEAGVAGLSVDALLGDILRDEVSAVETLETNTTITLDQLQRMKAGAAATAQSNINAVQGPSVGATALRIGGSALDTYVNTRARKSPTGKVKS